jgi:hypothetical protein
MCQLSWHGWVDPCARFRPQALSPEFSPECAPTKEVHVAVRHGGLVGRHLRAATIRMLGLDRTTIEHEIESTQVMLLGDIETKLVLLVKGFLAPLFQVFDFVEVGDPIHAQMVNDFVAGRI